MPIWGALGAALPAVVSGAASLLGGERQNRQNQAAAQKQMDFQERMRNTEWQAAVEDMRKAGVNPALAYSHGGASAPGGALATYDDSVGKGVSSAMQMKMQQEQLKLLRAQTEKTAAEGIGASLDNARMARDNAWGEARQGYFFNRDGTPTPRLTDMFRAEAVQATGDSRYALARAKHMEFSQEQQQALMNVIRELGGRGDIGAIIGPLILSFINGSR